MDLVWQTGIDACSEHESVQRLHLLPAAQRLQQPHVRLLDTSLFIAVKSLQWRTHPIGAPRTSLEN